MLSPSPCYILSGRSCEVFLDYCTDFEHLFFPELFGSSLCVVVVAVELAVGSSKHPCHQPEDAVCRVRLGVVRRLLEIFRVRPKWFVCIVQGSCFSFFYGTVDVRVRHSRLGILFYWCPRRFFPTKIPSWRAVFASRVPAAIMGALF